MKVKAMLVGAVLTLTLQPFVPGQDVQVSRENKTIAVTANAEVVVEPEFAVLQIGYHNYATAKDVAFEENVRTSTQILKALLDAGVAEQSIETEALSLHRTSSDEDRSSKAPQLQPFEARQLWTVVVSVSQAQTIVEVAVRAGANEVQDVNWSVSDPVALQAKAGAAALAKAQRVAEQMAKGLNAKLVGLVYASNTVPVPKAWRHLWGGGGGGNSMSELRGYPAPKLKLFPPKVREEATVHAVFAIE